MLQTAQLIPELAGVYMILHVSSGKVYVGSAVNLRKRKHQHWHYLRHGKHHNQHLQRAWNKYGEADFLFRVLYFCSCSCEQLLFWEQFHVDLYAAVDEGFNMVMPILSHLGYKYSEESKRRMRVAQKGRIITPAAREKISLSLTGKVQSSETIERRRAKLLGKKQTSAQRLAHSASLKVFNKTPRLSAFGRNQCLVDWAREFGMNHATLRNRLRRSRCTLEQALTKPIV